MGKPNKYNKPFPKPVPENKEKNTEIPDPVTLQEPEEVSLVVPRVPELEEEPEMEYVPEVVPVIGSTKLEEPPKDDLLEMFSVKGNDDFGYKVEGTVYYIPSKRLILLIDKEGKPGLLQDHIDNYVPSNIMGYNILCYVKHHTSEPYHIDVKDEKYIDLFVNYFHPESQARQEPGDGIKKLFNHLFQEVIS